MSLICNASGEGCLKAHELGGLVELLNHAAAVRMACYVVACVRARERKRMCACKCAFAYVCMPIQVCMNARLHTCVRMRGMHARTRTRMHPCTHTRMHPCAHRAMFR